MRNPKSEYLISKQIQNAVASQFRAWRSQNIQLINMWRLLRRFTPRNDTSCPLDFGNWVLFRISDLEIRI